MTIVTLGYIIYLGLLGIWGLLSLFNIFQLMRFSKYSAVAIWVTIVYIFISVLILQQSFQKFSDFSTL